MQFPILHTSRLHLIEINDSHLHDLFKLFGNPAVVKYYNLLPLSQLEDGQRFIDWYRTRFADGLAIRWGIAIQGESNIIGTVGFNNYTKHHRAGIGYDLQEAYWGKGYITEALRAVVDYGFNQLDVNRVEAEVMQGNTASQKVLQKLGFTNEGVLRQWMYWNDTHYDMTMFSLLKSDVE